MSKIGTESIVGQIFIPIVTTFTYDELNTYRNNNTSIGVNNAIIFSVPQSKSEDNIYDNANETSIWATDNSGMLCPLSFPYSMILNIKESLERYEENTGSKKIISAEWVTFTGESTASISPNINIKVEVKYANNRYSQINITGIKVYKDRQFLEEYTPVINSNEIINWYDTPGTYYLQGLVNDSVTGSIIATTNDKPLEWTINKIVKQLPVCNYIIDMKDKSYYAEFKLTANTPGVFEIISVSDGRLNISTGRITNLNNYATFKIYNDSYKNISPQITYKFTPDDIKYFYEVNNSFIIDNINKQKENYTYYWYGGAGPIDSSTVPGQGDGWHLIEGTPTSIETGDLSNSKAINWILAVPIDLGLNHISNGDDVTDAYNVSIITCADDVTYKIFRQMSSTKRTNVNIIK